MNPFKSILHPTLSLPWLAKGAAFLGVLIYSIQAWGWIHNQVSVMDEGLYQYKGLSFLRSDLFPFQDYGFYTNHMPLSYLIPGTVLFLFGAGLGTVRLYALGLQIFLLVGVWIVSRRIGTDWLAAGSIWVMALNAAPIKMYSMGASQGLVACLVVWTMVAALGGDRPIWQVLVGASLAGAALLTRLNLAPLLPLLLVYILWEYGRRTAGWAALTGLAVVLIGHLVFWPGILRPWAAWAPPDLFPFLAAWRPPEGQPFWDPEVTSLSRLYSLLQTVRFHLISATGLLAALILWPRPGSWNAPNRRRVAVFLTVSFLVLFAAHAWASLGTHSQTDQALGSDYCVYCLPVYTAFYGILGIFLLVVLLANLQWRTTLWQRILGGCALISIAAGVGLGAYQEISAWALRWRIPRLKTLVTQGRWLPAEATLREFLDSQFGLGFETAKHLVPAVIGGLIGLLLLMIAIWFGRITKRQGREPVRNGLLVVLAAMLILSPTSALGGGYTTYDCSGDVPAAHAAAGKILSAAIPAESAVYWQGSLSPAPLLYLDSPKLLPGQLHLDYTLRLSGDDDDLLRYGFWSESLARKWLAASDFAIVSPRYFGGWLREELQDPARFELIAVTEPLAPCDPDSILYVFGKSSP